MSKESVFLKKNNYLSKFAILLYLINALFFISLYGMLSYFIKIECVFFGSAISILLLFAYSTAYSFIAVVKEKNKRVLNIKSIIFTIMSVAITLVLYCQSLQFKNVYAQDYRGILLGVEIIVLFIVIIDWLLSFFVFSFYKKINDKKKTDSEG